tara:strand:- start:175 stop:309 length:135 start_codon:yes stop_codon:yes gene_type:complete
VSQTEESQLLKEEEEFSEKDSLWLLLLGLSVLFGAFLFWLFLYR